MSGDSVALVLGIYERLTLGTLRVLGPWPGGTTTTTLAWPDVVGRVLLAIGGFALVVAVELLATWSHRAHRLH